MCVNSLISKHNLLVLNMFIKKDLHTVLHGILTVLNVSPAANAILFKKQTNKHLDRCPYSSIYCTDCSSPRNKLRWHLFITEDS